MPKRKNRPVEAIDLTLERILSMQEASQITSLSVDTLERRYRHLIVRLSPRRRGIKLRAALAITNGAA
jgi:hypothetical protein